MSAILKEQRISILLIDDQEGALILLRKALERDDTEILQTTSPGQGLRIFKERHPPIVIVDQSMPEMTGLEVMGEILRVDPRTEVILLTGDYSTDSAVLAIQSGAADYWTKPFSPITVRANVDRLIDKVRQQRSQTRLDEEALTNFEFEGIIGRSPQLLDMLTRVRRVAPHYRNVLITGGSGTGKEQVARTIHRLSPVGNRPLVVCNCAAIVEGLFESEMFGHVRGAFTGAHTDKAGMFEAADKSAIFLDEVGELSLPAQAKLLRVLQNQETQRVGSGQTCQVDVRVIAATNRDLAELVREKKFREDLYYRLAIVEIRVPSLIDRKEDLPLLQKHFVKKSSAAYGRDIRGLTRRAQIQLSMHSWPGNVRELENVIAHGCMVAEESYIDTKDLPDYLQHQSPSLTTTDSELISMETLDRRHARRVLEIVDGNKLKAAEVLNISRTTLYRLLG